MYPFVIECLLKVETFMRIVWSHLIRPSGAWIDRYDYQTKEKKAYKLCEKRVRHCIQFVYHNINHVICWNSKLYKSRIQDTTVLYQGQDCFCNCNLEKNAVYAKYAENDISRLSRFSKKKYLALLLLSINHYRDQTCFLCINIFCIRG